MILNGRLAHTDQPASLHIEEGKIIKIEPFAQGAGEDKNLSNLYVSSGFFDPQINGFAGVDFNSDTLTSDDLHRAAEAIAFTGITAFFATLITAPFEKLHRQLKMLSETMDRDSLFRETCRGIHLEGPYISPEEGPRGMHPLQFIRPPDWNEFRKLQEASENRIRLVTLAPESKGGLKFIEKAASDGVVVAVGHTGADDETLESAFKAGARLSTHLGNGIGRRLAGHRNSFTKQLSMDGLMATIIVDGFHLPDYQVKNMVRAKGAERILLCTDAISGALQPPGKYSLAGIEIDVNEGGRTSLPGKVSLGGSTLSMPKAISNVMKFAGIGLATAIRMASENGRKLFPDLIAAIASGQRADIVLFEFEEEKVVIEKTFLKGEEAAVNR